MSDATTVMARLRRFFDDRPGDVAAVYLFGSVARGTATAASDVDVGVLLATEPAGDLAGLLLGVEADLEKTLQRDVQIVVLNTAPCDLVHRVLRDGRLVLDRHPSLRIAFEVRARNEFFDLEPILRQYRGGGAGTPRR
jgi:predicted nucleotidyltransferase